MSRYERGIRCSVPVVPTPPATVGQRPCQGGTGWVQMIQLETCRMDEEQR